MAGKNQARQFRKLKEQIADIEKKFIPELLENVAAALEKTIDQEFASSKDPDGIAWEKKDKKSKKGKLLEASGDLKNSSSVEVDGTKVVAKFSSGHAIFQQGKRNLLPKRRRIGKEWAKTIRTEVRRTKRKYKAKAEKK